MPRLAAVLPLVEEEEAALAEGDAQADHPAVRGAERRPPEALQVVRHAGGFVDDEQIDAPEAADRLLVAGQADNGGAVLERQLTLGSFDGGMQRSQARYASMT